MGPGVIFDLGSTLIRFVHPRKWAEVVQVSIGNLVDGLVELGIHVDRHGFSKSFGEQLFDSFHQREEDFIERPTSDLVRKVAAEYGYANIPPDLLNAAIKRYYQESESHWEPMPELEQVLTDLARSGYPMAIVSNAADDGNVQRLIDQAGVRSYFQPIVVSAAVGIRKPDRKIFDIVLDEWKMPAEQVVMIGDTLTADILGAQQVGMRAIWITAEADRPDNHAHEGRIVPDASVAELRQVPGQIRELFGLD